MSTTRRAIRAASAPDILFKAQRALRTIVQALVVLLPTANLAALAVVSYLNEQTDVIVPAWIFAGLNAVIVVTALVMGLVARLMAVPGVNDILARIGLGSVPRSALEE
ncbi:hypothetical protein [Microbacterium sp. A1-JK]|uniref:hypothetical protein n=1 Tax=Microbacterium sp. A1-JK TaxID=3177516 RepID=UPI00388AA7F6